MLFFFHALFSTLIAKCLVLAEAFNLFCLIYCKTISEPAFLAPVLKTISTSSHLFISLLHVVKLKNLSAKSQTLLPEPLHFGGSINSEKRNSINGKPFCMHYESKSPIIQACSLKVLTKVQF